jgi:hypothetical protein
MFHVKHFYPIKAKDLTRPHTSCRIEASGIARKTCLCPGYRRPREECRERFRDARQHIPNRIWILGIESAFKRRRTRALHTELATGPANLASLSRRLGLHDRSARDFLDTLVALKLLDRENGRYSNTAETDIFLDRAKPSYVGGDNRPRASASFRCGL